MRGAILLGWLFLPLGAWIYHEGPGQDLMKLDEVDGFLARADEAVHKEDWMAAIKNYKRALEKLPAEKVHTGRRIRLALNQARMRDKGLPESRIALTKLVEEMTADPKADPKLLDEARRAQACAQYYMTWLMRLEGYQRAEWEPEIDAARQNYRLLAERARESGKSAKGCLEDLESAVKLSRLDLEELQGIPLPSQ